jgi:xanthine/uracil/vitamin C permease (AzgA family)
MPDASSNADLLRSLGKLARGLSALFWGLPASLIVCAETAKVEVLKPLGIAPALAINALLLFGLWQMGDFQKQERPWRIALDRAKLLGLVNLGLSPFLYWFSRMPEQPFFRDAVGILVLSALIFLFNLNVVLKQLGAMLPDESLRQETRQFTALNRWLLVAWVVFLAASLAAPHVFNLPAQFSLKFLFWLQHMETAVTLFLGLAPLAITMALIWKTKEVILDSVFGSRS